MTRTCDNAKGCRDEAKGFIQGQEWVKAANCYDVMFKEYPADVTVQDRYAHARCFYKLGQYDTCRNELEPLAAKELDNAYINNLLGWSLYHLHLKNMKEENGSEGMESAKRIVSITQQGEFSPYTIAAFAAMGYLKKKKQHQHLLEWVEGLDAGKLSRTPKEWTDPKGNVKKSYSDWEKYHLYAALAYIEHQHYDEALNVCQAYLTDETCEPSKMDLWIKRQKAKALFHLGSREDSLALYRELLAGNKETYLYYETAYILFHLDRVDEAIAHAARALLLKQQRSFKVNSIQLLAKLLINTDPTAAHLHTHLLYKIREENGWKISNSLKQAWDRVPDEIRELPADQVERKLKPLWEELCWQGHEKQEGQVQKLLEHGKAGFLQAKDGKRYYFSVREANISPDKMGAGCPVTFYLEAGFDKKKNQPVWNAVQVRLPDVEGGVQQ